MRNPAPQPGGPLLPPPLKHAEQGIAGARVHAEQADELVEDRVLVRRLKIEADRTGREEIPETHERGSEGSSRTRESCGNLIPPRRGVKTAVAAPPVS